jgi:hypothetical protein
MCKAFTDCRKSYIDYQSRCFQHVSTPSTGFVKYCEVPQGHFAFVPAKDPDPDKRYTPPNAIQFDSDGYWHLGWRISDHASCTTKDRLSFARAAQCRHAVSGRANPLPHIQGAQSE